MRLTSEDHIIARIAQHFPNAHAALELARGDDCALLRPAPGNGALCVSSDLFVEDVHFRRAYFTPQDTGHKALAVNISDIAAMGARPLAFTLCLALPPDTDAEWLDALFAGMAALARTHNVALAGGDISRADKISLAITIWGATEHGFLRRGTAQPGDSVFVVGETGLARVGLHVLEAQGRTALADWPAACAAHLTPAPQVAAGLVLAQLSAWHERPITLMDLSDGLARDLPRLLGWTENARACGADSTLPESALHPEVRRYAAQQGLDAAAVAFAGGEDYALLGACPAGIVPALRNALPEAHIIGTVTASGLLRCNANAVTDTGFDHFA